MAMTPKDYLEISEAIEGIYQRIVDELLINIAKHFTVKGWERTRYWEIKKLSEMGALTEESVQIIAKNTGKLPEEIRKAFLQVAERACMDIDPQLKKAAEKGVLQDPGTEASTSVLMRDMVQAYADQAVDKMNMTNQTMLESTRQVYQRAVIKVVSEEQLEEAKQILETQSLEVTTGQETRVRAIRKAMDQMSAAGIMGFYDRAGRAWSPDAYSAMVVRTTSHNAYVKAIQTRQQEFGGGDVFQVSSHPGARPLCYPYQGKFFSWGGGPGEFTDGGGKKHRYDNIANSSYGEPAGLFGINCGHHPIPMIPGFSYPQDGPEQDEEKNRKEYEQSQVQRAYEREIRKAKRDLEIAKATHDDQLIEDAKKRVKDEQARMRDWIASTGRVRRYDREQIGDGKRPPAPRRAAPDDPVKTISGALRADPSAVDIKQLPEKGQRVISKSIEKTLKKYPVLAEHTKQVVYDAAMDKAIASSESLTGTVKVSKHYQDIERLRKEYAFDVKQKLHPDGTTYESIITHELGHQMDGLLTRKGINGGKITPFGVTRTSVAVQHEVLERLGLTDQKLREIRAGYKAQGLSGADLNHAVAFERKEFITDHVSIYAAENSNEFFAELFAEYTDSPKPREAARIFGEILERMLGEIK